MSKEAIMRTMWLPLAGGVLLLSGESFILLLLQGRTAEWHTSWHSASLSGWEGGATRAYCSLQNLYPVTFTFKLRGLMYTAPEELNAAIVLPVSSVLEHNVFHGL